MVPEDWKFDSALTSNTSTGEVRDWLTGLYESLKTAPAVYRFYPDEEKPYLQLLTAVSTLRDACRYVDPHLAEAHSSSEKTAAADGSEGPSMFTSVLDVSTAIAGAFMPEGSGDVLNTAVMAVDEHTSKRRHAAWSSFKGKMRKLKADHQQKSTGEGSSITGVSVEKGPRAGTDDRAYYNISPRDWDPIDDRYLEQLETFKNDLDRHSRDDPILRSWLTDGGKLAKQKHSERVQKECEESQRE